MLSKGLSGRVVDPTAGARPGGKGRIVRCLFAMLLGTAVGLTGACAADSPPASSADAGTSTVRGVVRDTAGKPVADVDIRLERTDESSSKNGTTTADGSFELQTVPAGAY